MLRVVIVAFQADLASVVRRTDELGFHRTLNRSAKEGVTKFHWKSPNEIKNVSQEIHSVESAHDLLRVRRGPLEVFVRPRSIAIIGATEKIGGVGHSLATNLLDGPFGERVWLINPKHKTLLNRTCYSSVAELPTPADLAIIAVPAGVKMRKHTFKRCKSDSSRMFNAIYARIHLGCGPQAEHSANGPEDRQRHVALKPIGSAPEAEGKATKVEPQKVMLRLPKYRRALRAKVQLPSRTRRLSRGTCARLAGI